MRSLGNRVGLPALLVVAGCGPGEIDLPLGFPAGARSVLLFSVTAEEIEAFAFDRSEAPIRLEALGEEAVFTALFYGRSLAELGFGAGAQRPPEPGEASIGVPPDYVDAQTATADDDWSSLDALPPDIAAYRAYAPPLCPSITAETDIPLPHDQIAALLSLEEDAALLVTRKPLDGPASLVRITAGATEPIPGLPVDLHPQTAAIDPNGRLSVAGRNREGETIVGGSLGSALMPVPPIPEIGGGQIRWLAVPKDGTTGRYAETSSSALFSYAAGQWRLLWDGGGPGGLRTGGVVWIGPDDLFVLGENQRMRWSLVRVTGGRPELHELVTATAPSLLVDVPGVGALMGNDSGTIFVFNGTSFENLGSIPTARPIRAATAFGARWLAYSTEAFEVGLLDRTTGTFCDPVRFEDDPAYLAPLGSSLLVGIDQLGGDRLLRLDFE